MNDALFKSISGCVVAHPELKTLVTDAKASNAFAGQFQPDRAGTKAPN